MTNEEILLEDFEKRCPWMYKKLDGHYYDENRRHEIRLYMNDGYKYVYDSLDKFPHPIVEFNSNRELRELSDELWLKGFSDKVHSQLRKNRMVQYELAKAAGISERTLSRYLTYRSMPSINTVHRMASALNCIKKIKRHLIRKEIINHDGIKRYCRNDEQF